MSKYIIKIHRLQGGINIFAKIIGTGSYIPDLVVDNNAFTKLVDTSDEWIVSHTGISERRISAIEMRDMAERAALNALENAGVDAGELDMIIVSSVTQDYIYPSTACILQGRIGANRAVGFDISAACCGFLYALDMVRTYIIAGRVKKALIVSAELMSKMVDFTDRSTCILFGDGAGAVVVSAVEDDESAVLSTFIHSDGAGAGLLYAKDIEFKNPFTEAPAPLYKDSKEHYLYMNGNEIYKFAVRMMESAASKVLEDAGMTPDDIDLFVPHQANLRIIKSMAQRYKLNMDKVYINIDKYANTSSASIPICLDEVNRGGRVKKGGIIVMAGVGSGLTYGSALIRW